MAKPFYRWENRLILDKFNIAERYIRGDICIILESKSGIGRSTVNREGFAFPQESIGSVQFGKWAAYSTAFQDQIAKSWNVHNGCQDGMLICPVKTVDNVKILPLPTGKDCKRLKEFIDRGVGCFYSATRSFVTQSVAPHGEVELIMLVAGANNLPHKVVESGPKVVDSIAYYHGKGRGDGGDHENNIKLIRLAASGASVKIFPTEGAELPFQIIDVMIGPFDL
jgi:hypothetical protein